MKIKERLTAKIDIQDAIFGGSAIYVSVLLVASLLIFGADFALRFFGLMGQGGDFVTASGVTSENLFVIFVAVLLALFFVTFFIVVLFEESFFSKHEKGLVDLLGLGLVWGMSFVAIDALVESVVVYLAMFQGWETYYMLSLRSTLFGPFFLLAVLYIIFLPVAIYYLRKNHKEHMEKTK